MIRQKGLLALLALFLAFSFISCGRMGPPLAPELLAPATIHGLHISGTREGVQFSWVSPEVDQRGQQLKSMDGYRLYRKSITKTSDILSSEVPFELIASVSDTHLLELEKARLVLVEQGRPAHRAKVPDELKAFTTLDRSVTAGATYVYKVVPFNQGNVEGQSYDLVRVMWRGQSSEIKLLTRSELTEDQDEG